MQGESIAPQRPVGPVSALLIMVTAMVLAGCGSTAKLGGGRDGPPLSGPSKSELSQLPDAEPRADPLRVGGPNKPYEVLGRRYVPETRDVPLRETGLASWYGRKFHGRRTATGEIYDMHAMTAAHKTMPLPSYARVRNLKDGREIIVRVNDRGPFVEGRVIDLSYAAAVRLGVANGVSPVEVERLTFEDIRTGAWRRDGGRDVVPEPPRAVATTPVPPPAPRAALPVNPAPTVLADLGSAEPTDGAVPAASSFWVQLGAFRERQGVEGFQQRLATELDWLAPQMAVFDEAPLYRLQAGPYASREAAQDAAERVRAALQLVPLIVERR